VAVGDGDANAGGADLNGVITEDFASFEDHFEFFAGVAILFEAADLWDGIEGDGVAKGFVIVGCGIEGSPSSCEQVGCSLQTCTAGGLVGADDDPADSSGIVQWFQGDDHLGCGAVGAGDDAGGGECCLRVDFGDDQCDVRVHSPVAGFVDYAAAGANG